METRSKGVWAFLGLTFGLSWAGMFGMKLLGWSLVNPLAQWWAFLPAIAAVVVRRWVTREGFGDAGLRLRFREAWREYVLAWLGPLVLAAATVGLAAALGLWHFDLAGLGDVVPGLPGWTFVLVLILVVPLLAPLYWGEEFGWTSYLRLRLCPGRPWAAVMLTGLIWAVWHYPLAFLGYIEFDNVLVGLAVWTLSFQFQEIALAWLRTRSGSIWTTSVAHAGNNMVLSLLTGILLQDGGGLNVVTVMLVTMVPLAATSLCIVLAGRWTGGAGPGQAVPASAASCLSSASRAAAASDGASSG
ncbi:CPBP family glutamic-type intramembrane protease [Flindersiella endophytica]